MKEFEIKVKLLKEARNKAEAIDQVEEDLEEAGLIYLIEEKD